MATKTNETLPGIIGQCYEDRRNGEFGILVSRDTKCKTMNYQREDGTEFVRSYSHFRSYMRKKADAPAESIKEEAYAEAELTSIEVSDEDAVKMEKNAKRKAKAEQKAEEAKNSKEIKAKVSAELKEKSYADMCKVLDDYVDSFNSNRVECKHRDYKNYCVVNIAGRSLISFYSRHKKREVYIVCASQLVTEPKHTMVLQKCKHHSVKSAGVFTESHTINFEELKDYLEELRPVLIEIISYVKTKESED